MTEFKFPDLMWEPDPRNVDGVVAYTPLNRVHVEPYGGGRFYINTTGGDHGILRDASDGVTDMDSAKKYAQKVVHQELNDKYERFTQIIMHIENYAKKKETV